MTPTDDDGDIPDHTHDELVAQIVPLRRRHDDTDRGDPPNDEPQTNDSQVAPHDTDGWSVFDPPEDLKPAARPHPHRHRELDSEDYLSSDDLEPPCTSTPHPPHRLLAFAGIALAMLAIVALAVLTLKGHAGASTRQPTAPTPPATLTSANRPLAPPAALRPRQATRPKHRQPTKRKPSPRRPPHTVTTPTGEGVSPGHGSVEHSPALTRSEPSSTGTSPTRGVGGEFGIER